MDGTVSLTLIVPDLSIDVLCQPAHMWEIKYHFVKASSFDLLSSPTAFRYARFPELSCVNPIQHYTTILRFEGGDSGRYLRIFASERGCLIVASRNQMGAAVGAEKGVGEGEVAFADEEDAVFGREGHVGGGRFRALFGLARGRLGFFMRGWSFRVWVVAGRFRLWPLRLAHCSLAHCSLAGWKVAGEYARVDGIRLRCQVAKTTFRVTFSSTSEVRVLSLLRTRFQTRDTTAVMKKLRRKNFYSHTLHWVP